MMCPNFIYWILQVLKDPKASKALKIKDYLLASSIATATATCHLKQPAVVSSHGVVTGSNETHHLFAVDAFAIASGDRTFKKGLQDKAFLNIAL